MKLVKVRKRKFRKGYKLYSNNYEAAILPSRDEASKFKVFLGLGGVLISETSHRTQKAADDFALRLIKKNEKGHKDYLKEGYEIE